jgi:hypothetical protein
MLLVLSSVVEQGTHKPLVESPNLSLGTKKDVKVLAVCGGLNPNETTFCYIWGSQKQEISMSTLKTQDQGLIILSQQDYLPILVESFLIDRKAQGLSPDTIELYTKKLKYFLKYCERQALTQISQMTSDFIRRYLLELSETHNPGGVHVCFRSLRTMLYWIEEEEIMPDGWKNPIRRIKAPKLPIDPIEPIQIEEIHQLLKTCKSNYSGTRDQAMILGLLDTGARITFVAGSFFERVPEGDTYVLSRILHDWDDDRASAILTTVRASAPSGARVLVLESVIPEDNEPNGAKWLDLLMLVLAGGRERTEGEWRALLKGAGLRPERIEDGLVVATCP